MTPIITAKNTLSCLRVLNDIPKRGVVLINEYNKQHTNGEEQKQFLLLAVKKYKQQTTRQQQVQTETFRL